MPDEERSAKILKSNELENVSAGYYGKDWGDYYQWAYQELGIEHKRNKLKKDEYYYKGQQIDKSTAKQLAEGKIAELYYVLSLTKLF